MRAIWSFWSKPYRQGISTQWLSEKHYLLSWVLSVETARKHYPETSLYCDSRTAKLLLDILGLEFSDVQIKLDQLASWDTKWWALGKVYVYLMQKEPFIHLENDAFLWQRLPDRLETAQLFAQNPEYFQVGVSRSYLLDEFEAQLKTENDYWLPEEWIWSHKVFRKFQKAVSCGLFGGNQLDFIHYFARTAIKLIEHGPNRAALLKTTEKFRHMLLVEQYLLGTLIDYHRNNTTSPYQEIDIQYLFPSPEESSKQFNDVGYTHLIGPAKRNPNLAAQIETRVATDYPIYYERCMKYVESKTS